MAREEQCEADTELMTTRLLLRAANILSRSVDLPTVLGGLTEVLIEATGRHRVVTSLFDARRDEFEVVASEGSAVLPVGLRYPLSGIAPETARSIREKRATVVDFDAPGIPSVPLERAWRMDSRLMVAIPLVFQGRVTGYVRVDEPGSREPFTERDIAIAEAIATQAAAAIENARLYAAEHRHARLAEALTDIDTGLHSSMDPNEMMSRAVSEGARTLGADTAAMSLHRDNEFVVQHSYGFAMDLVGAVIPESQERHSMLALQTQQVVAIEDTSTDARVDAAHLNAYGVAAVIVVPLVLAGKAIGALYFNFAQSRHFDETEIAFVRRLSSSLSLAIENARLLQSEARRARINEALARIDHSIHATFDREEILQRVALESAEAIGADSTVLCILEGDLWVVKYAHNLPADVIGQGFTTDQSPFMGIAAATQRPVAIDDAYNDPRAVYETQHFLGVRAVMMTSLIARDQVIGGLFFNYTDIHHFTPEEIEYASRLALSVGLAIENGRLYESERTIASRLQEALLTMPKHVSGIDFAYSYRSATEGMLVGGDFYDIFEVGDQLVGLTVGDVAGKGLDAAVLTSLAKNTIRAHASEGDKTPGEVLALTNSVLYGATPPESFITVFFGVLDCRHGRLSYASAAHPAAVVLRNNGDVDLLKATGPLLGVFSGSRFGQSEIELAPGERLFLYTDGLTEAKGATEFYGDERMLELLHATRDVETSAAVDLIIEDVVAYSGNRLRDDVAILAVDYVACPRRM